MRRKRRPPIFRCRHCGEHYAAWREREYCRPVCPGRMLGEPVESLRDFRRRLKGSGY